MLRNAIMMFAALVTVGFLAESAAMAQYGYGTTYPVTRSYYVPATPMAYPSNNCPNGNCSLRPASTSKCINGRCPTAACPTGNCGLGQCASGNCAGCPNGNCRNCPNGVCPTGCANGQCGPRPVNCVNGKCYPVAPSTGYAPAYRYPASGYSNAFAPRSVLAPVAPVSYSRNNPFYE